MVGEHKRGTVGGVGPQAKPRESLLAKIEELEISESLRIVEAVFAACQGPCRVFVICAQLFQLCLDLRLPLLAGGLSFCSQRRYLIRFGRAPWAFDSIKARTPLVAGLGCGADAGV